MTDQPELKPCPFCGGEAGCMGGDTFGYWIECGGCILDLGMHSGSYEDTTGFFSTRSEAIAAWNRRANKKPKEISQLVLELVAESIRRHYAGEFDPRVVEWLDDPDRA